MGRDGTQKAKYFPTSGNQTAGDQTDGQLYDFGTDQAGRGPPAQPAADGLLYGVGTDQAMQSSRTTNPLFGAVDAVAAGRGLSRRRRSSVDQGDGYLAFTEDQL